MCWRQIQDVGDDFDNFSQQQPLSLYIYVKCRAPTFKRCHQHPKIVANFESPTPRCHQHRSHRFVDITYVTMDITF